MVSKTFKKNRKFDLSAIFGAERVNSWNKRYSLVWESEDIQNWVQSKMKAYVSKGKEAEKFTITGYFNAMEKYCKFTGLKPEELLAEEIDNRNDRLCHYLSYLVEEKKKNPVSVANGLQSKIKSFFSDRGRAISYQMPCYDSGINRHEIILDRQMLQAIEHALSSPAYRLLFKFQAQTGLRISDILEELVSGNYEIEKHKDHYFIRKFITQKRKIIINFLFLTTELSNMITSCTGVQDLRKLDLTTLFMNRLGTNRINRNDYLTRIKEICSELNYEGNMKTHSLRKWFNTQLTHAPIHIEMREHLSGHKQQHLSNAYNRDLSNIEKVYESFLSIEEYICIDAEIIDKTNDKIIELEKSLAEEKELREQMKSNYEQELIKLKQVQMQMLDIIRDLKKDSL